MSGNSSATGGYLRQLNTPLSDAALMDEIQEAVVGITAIPANMVRPRWQPLPPKQPEPNVNWCAIGIMSRTATDYPVIRHVNGGPDRLTRWSTVSILASFYGPENQVLAEQLRDGLYIDQNRELLNLKGVKLTDVGELTSVPDLVNVQWINRCDLSIRLAQVVDRDYNVLDILSSQGIIAADTDVDTTWDTVDVITGVE